MSWVGINMCPRILTYLVYCYSALLYYNIKISTTQTTASMDNMCETTFLLEIERRKASISSKNNSKTGRDKKTEAWAEIREALLVKHGKEFDERQLLKKWSNLQERVKNKLRQRNMTGGGTSADLNIRDEITIRRLPMMNLMTCSLPSVFF